MNKETVAQFKELLEKELEKLEAELKTVGHINPDNPNDWEPSGSDVNDRSADPNKRASNIEAYEANTAILKELEIQYNDVKRALKKIEDGTYGTCEVEDHQIDEGRLNANPAARTCIEHSKDLE